DIDEDRANWLRPQARSSPPDAAPAPDNDGDEAGRNGEGSGNGHRHPTADDLASIATDREAPLKRDWVLDPRKVNGADDTAEPDQRPAPEPEPESEAAPSLTTAFELTVLAKAGGPLTKRISLNHDGSLAADGSACVMGRGQARRAHLTGLAAFAALING